MWFLTVCVHLLTFVLDFLRAGAFAFVLLMIVVDCTRSLLFAFV